MSTTQTAAEFTIRRKILTVFGAKFHIYNAEGRLLGFCKQKAFKLKEDIRVYTDETMSDERLVIKARSAIDFSAAYDVVDSREQRKLGALRRKGFKSIFRDEWQVLDEDDQETGVIREDSAWMALFRRWLSNLIPQSYHLKDLDGADLAHFRTHFNPFVHRMTVTVYPDGPLDPMLVLAAGILLVAIEGRQG
ncbi:MAG TPA: hypothetical protein VML55_19775 [Planctomycetaceae bacterium]|nr:hypothetical protein [Planctomycetaceae bacterium]